MVKPVDSGMFEGKQQESNIVGRAIDRQTEYTTIELFLIDMKDQKCVFWSSDR